MTADRNKWGRAPPFVPFVLVNGTTELEINKYLQQSQLASGLSTGQAGTNFINANNAYQQNRAAISNNFADQQAQLLKWYAGDKLQLDKDILGQETNINDKWYDRNWATNERDYNRSQDEYMKNKANEDEMFDKLYMDLMGDNFNSTAEMAARIDEFKDYLSPERYAYLKSQISRLSDNKEQRSADEDYALWKGSTGTASGKIVSTAAVYNTSGSGIRGDKEGDNFSIELDGKKYRIENGGKVDDQDLIDKASGLSNYAVFGYKDKIYVKYNGSVYLVQGRGYNKENGHYADLWKKVFG